jgi:hypothetical protein
LLLAAEAIEMSVKLQPYPRAYVVSGAGTEDVNGLYEIDRSLLTRNGQLQNWPGTDLGYLKKEHNVQEAGMVEVFFEQNYFRWFLMKKCQDYETMLYEGPLDNEYLSRRPRNSCSEDRGASLSPTVQHVGLVFVEGMRDIHPHDFITWIVENDVLGCVASGAESIQSTRFEAQAALRSLLGEIEGLPKLLGGRVSSENSMSYDETKDVERDFALVESTMKYLTDLSESVLEMIGKDVVVAKTLRCLEGLRQEINSNRAQKMML